MLNNIQNLTSSTTTVWHPRGTGAFKNPIIKSETPTKIKPTDKISVNNL